MKRLIGKITGLAMTPSALIRRAALLSVGRSSIAPKLQSPQQANRIFISFPYHSVGDLILALTLIDQVHELWPEASVDVAVGALMAPLVQELPYVNRVFSLQRARTLKWVPSTYAELSDIRKLYKSEIAPATYDIAISPRWDSRDSFSAAYLAFLTGAPIRCGYSGASDGGPTEVDKLLTIAAKGGVGEHESLRYTRLLSRCGIVPQGLDDSSRPLQAIQALQTIARQRRERSIHPVVDTSTPFAILSPGATNACRIWSLASFAEVGRALHERYKMRIVVIGSPQDAGLCRDLCQKMGDFACSVAGQTTSLQMLDLIAASDVFIGTDSGPGHIAGGLGINTISINAHTSACPPDHPLSPIRWRPAGDRVRLVQPSRNIEPCKGFCETNYPHCITGIEVDAVLRAFEDLRTL